MLTGVTGDMAVMTEEPFGPIAPITAFAGFDEAIAVANSTAFGLAGFVSPGTWTPPTGPRRPWRRAWWGSTT